MQVSAAVAMESSDLDSSTEDDDARATAQNLSLSCVACRQHLRRVFLWEASKGSQGENDLGLFSSPQSSGCTFRPAALKARAAHFGLKQHAFMRVFKKVIGCIDSILIKVCAFVSR